MATNSSKTDPSLDPSTPSPSYIAMVPKWVMIQTLLDGTAAMRQAGEDYLPRHEEESPTNYSERLSKTTLYNMTELTLDSLVGKPFVKPIKLNSDVPAAIAAITPNIDMQGTDINSFSREWMRIAIAKGFAHAYVDMPVLTEADKVNRTKEQDNAENRRPYWRLIHPEHLLFAHAEIENGVERLTHVRILECYTELVGFAEIEKRRIRVITPGAFEVWEQQEVRVKGSKKTRIEWAKTEFGAYDLPYIPLITFYANRTGFMMAKPPLEDLAYLNIRHWQSTSDQISILTVARFPILAVAGAHDQTGDTMRIGPKQLLATIDPNGRFYYVEHKGEAIKAGKEDLADLVEAMASYGAEFLRKKVGGRTATERALDTAETMSPLKDMTNRFASCIAQALKITADWLKLPTGGTVKIDTDLTEVVDDPASLQALVAARKSGDISWETFIQALIIHGVIDDDLNLEDEKARVELESKVAMKAAADLAKQAAKDKAAAQGAPPDNTQVQDQNITAA